MKTEFAFNQLRPNQLKTCIFLTVEEFECVLNEIYGQHITVHCDLDGCWYESDKDLDICDSDICVELSRYYGVNVTSIHVDDCDITGVWICYKTE